jgi:hypothetical protein
MPQENVLLISDDNSSHILRLAAVEIPREHGVVMLSLPSQSINRMQSRFSRY